MRFSIQRRRFHRCERRHLWGDVFEFGRILSGDSEGLYGFFCSKARASKVKPVVFDADNQNATVIAIACNIGGDLAKRRGHGSHLHSKRYLSRRLYNYQRGHLVVITKMFCCVVRSTRS